MNKYFKEFLKRGAFFAGFGPVIMAIVYLVLSKTLENFTLRGEEVFLGVISTYIIAFVHAGASIFNQIEGWPISKSLAFHLGILYLAYTGCYLVNSWIPFDLRVLLVFTLAFILCYFVIWFTVFLSVKGVSKKLSARLQDKNKE